MSKKIRITGIIFFAAVFLKILLFILKISFLKSRIFGYHYTVDNSAFIPLRLSMSYIFLWYALDHITSGLEFNGLGNRLLNKAGVNQTFDFTNMARIWGILEVLIFLSFVIGFYLDVFSLLASLFVVGIIIIYYIANKSFLFRDVAIAGALITFFLLTR